MEVPGEFKEISTNKVILRCRVAGKGPLILLIHGWPESWYSWRHQIEPLVTAGYKVVVPDVRGYGGSSVPKNVEAYDMRTMINDILGLADHYEQEKFILIGHDWGAPMVWNTAAMFPDRVQGVVALSVPYTPRGKISSIALWRQIYGDRFFYQLYFQEPGLAEREFEKDVSKTLRKIYYSNCGESPSGLFKDNKAPNSPMLLDLPDPNPFPNWLSEYDLEYYTSQFEKTGFTGSLNRYRNQQRDWEDLIELDEARIKMPSCFIAGERDTVLRFVPNVDLIKNMKRWTDDLRICELIQDAGHWIQQEKPKEVNTILLKFLASISKNLR